MNRNQENYHRTNGKAEHDNSKKVTPVKIKLCGLRRLCDIDYANALQPEYIGFVFAPKSRRYVPPAEARLLRDKLAAGIQPVGVFVDEQPEQIAALAESGVIELVQLHGHEDADYIRRLRRLIHCPIIQAVRMDDAAGGADKTDGAVQRARGSTADFILLDSGAGGTGTVFDWSLLSGIERPYFLAGGLHPGNVAEAIRSSHPYAVDVSSGIETNGWKDEEKMRRFVREVRGCKMF